MTNMAQKPLPATPKNVGTICKMKTKNTENTYKKDNQEHYVKEENEDTTVNKRKCEHMNERILDSNDHHLEQHVSIHVTECERRMDTVCTHLSWSFTW